LYLLQHRGTVVAVGDLAEGLRVSVGWASRVADELALMGFVNRVRSERDRRVVHLELTEKAIKVAERLWSDHEAAIAAALSDLFPNERATVARFLRRLSTELDAPSIPLKNRVLLCFHRNAWILSPMQRSREAQSHTEGSDFAKRFKKVSYGRSSASVRLFTIRSPFTDISGPLRYNLRRGGYGRNQ